MSAGEATPTQDLPTPPRFKPKVDSYTRNLKVSFIAHAVLIAVAHFNSESITHALIDLNNARNRNVDRADDVEIRVLLDLSTRRSPWTWKRFA